MNLDLARPLYGLLLASMLVACGGGGGDPAAGPTAAGTATAENPVLATAQSAQRDECATDQ